METGYLDRLLRPRSIAVIGGGVWGESVIKNCRALGFDGLIWPVHPTKAEIAGEVAFTSVEDLPAAPDTALVVVNRYLTIDAVAALSALGCGGAICLASGFSEAQAEEETASALQDMLLQASGDMPLIGPNCYGLVSYLDGFALWPDQHGAERVDSGVAVIAQSSNVALNITMSQGGLPLAYVATTGNQAQIGLSGLGAAMLEDPRVTALGMYIEGIDDLRGFEALATRSRALGKPVVVVKAGRSALAKEATISHTASLAGSDAGARALLKRLGFAQVDSLPKMLETLKLLHVCGPLTSNRIASMSCSGGEASLIADAAEGYDVSFPALNSRQYVDLRKALGPMVALHNPLDYNTYIWRDTEALTQTFSAMLDKDLGLACVILDYPRHDRCNAQDWACVIDAIKAARATGTTPMAVVTTLHDTISEERAKELVAAGIAPLSGIENAMVAAEAAAICGRRTPLSDPLLLPLVPASTDVLSEADAKSALMDHGLRVPVALRAISAREAADKAELIGDKVVLKGEGIAHKTEAGAVVIGLSGAEETIAAAKAMPTDHFMIEEMVRGAEAELLIGCVLDPAHGYVLTLAGGGILTELLQDNVSLILPVCEEDIIAALDQLKIAKVLNGYRGRPAVDKAAIVQAVMAVQRFVTAHQGQVAEVEINPLMCTPDAAIAADALIKMERTQ